MFALLVITRCTQTIQVAAATSLDGIDDFGALIDADDDATDPPRTTVTSTSDTAAFPWFQQPGDLRRHLTARAQERAAEAVPLPPRHAADDNDSASDDEEGDDLPGEEPRQQPLGPRKKKPVYADEVARSRGPVPQRSLGGLEPVYICVDIGPAILKGKQVRLAQEVLARETKHEIHDGCGGPWDPHFRSLVMEQQAIGTCAYWDLYEIQARHSRCIPATRTPHSILRHTRTSERAMDAMYQDFALWRSNLSAAEHLFIDQIADNDYRRQDRYRLRKPDVLPIPVQVVQPQTPTTRHRRRCSVCRLVVCRCMGEEVRFGVGRGTPRRRRF